MQPGKKLNLTRSIRSTQKSGQAFRCPKEGTLVRQPPTCLWGRTLLLVEFVTRLQHREYVFDLILTNPSFLHLERATFIPFHLTLQTLHQKLASVRP